MKLSTGKVPFEIKFDNGAKEVIYFNPTDPDLASRLAKCYENILSRMSEVNRLGYNIKKDGKIDAPKKTASEVVELNERIRRIMCEEIDYGFNSDVSSTIFKYCSPFAIINGEYFVTQFLAAIEPEINKKVSEANESLEKKMSKHLKKYPK